MIVRLMPYADVFVTVTLTLDEAAALSDTLATLRAQKGSTLQKQSEELRSELDGAMERAVELKRKRGY